MEPDRCRAMCEAAHSDAEFRDLSLHVYFIIHNFRFICFPRNFSWRSFMSSRHAITPRGLNATRSPLSQGRFGRMFGNLTPATFGPNEADNIANLAALAD